MKTLTGVDVLQIPVELNKHLPPEAYGTIKYGQMSGKTDLDGRAVRDRLDEVFGPMGVGWSIVPHELAGRVEYHHEMRANKDGKEQLWHIVTLIAHGFQYSLIDDNGNLITVKGSVTSDQHDNMDEQYAYRGALTSLMKQFFGLLGGMNHIYSGEYTHIEAQRQLATPAPRTDEVQAKREKKVDLPWHKDQGKIDTLMKAIAKDFELGSLDDAHTMANYGTKDLVAIEDFATGKAFYEAVKTGVENFKKANQEAAKPKGSDVPWYRQKQAQADAERFTNQFGASVNDMLAKLEGHPKLSDFPTYADFQRQVRAAAVSGLWPIIVEECRVNKTPFGNDGKQLTFDTAIGPLNFVSRTKFVEAVIAFTTEPEVWQPVATWEDGEHKLPDMIRLVPKVTENKDGMKITIDKLLPLHDYAF